MHSQISAPTQFKGRISEMLSQLRMRRHVDMQNQERYAMDPIAQDDIKTVSSCFEKCFTLLKLFCNFIKIYNFVSSGHENFIDCFCV